MPVKVTFDYINSIMADKIIRNDYNDYENDDLPRFFDEILADITECCKCFMIFKFLTFVANQPYYFAVFAFATAAVFLAAIWQQSVSFIWSFSMFMLLGYYF